MWCWARGDLQGASEGLFAGSHHRNRKPIEDPTSIQGALRKWINPVISDLPLSRVDNLSLKPLVKKMVEGGLSPRTCEKYTLYCKQVVPSKKAAEW